MINYAGNTPMADITYEFKGKIGHVYAKLEYYNPSGSIKDRIAAFIIDSAVKSGELSSGQPIVETTSGNTGIAIAAYGARTKHPVHIFMPDWMSEERIKLMSMYGAELHLISKDEGGFIGAFKQADKLAAELGAYQVNQFKNINNLLTHYNSTAVEILQQLPDVTDFVSGVGSGGTIMGIGKRLKESRNARITAIEPDCAQILAGKKATGMHKIEGIGDEIIPDIVDLKMMDKILPINDDDAIAMSAKIARELGIGVGISSGANFIGAVLADRTDGRKVATVFADDNKKYLSGALSAPVYDEEKMLSSRIELLDVKKMTI